MGIIWNYALTFHASKPGGTDATGEYAGEAFLTIEPDFASVQAAAASEGHSSCPWFSTSGQNAGAFPLSLK